MSTEADEERLVLSSIYTDSEFTIVSPFEYLFILSPLEAIRIEIKVTLPSDYPESSPKYQITSSDSFIKEWLDYNPVDCHSILDTDGVVVYTLIEFIREHLSQAVDLELSDINSSLYKYIYPPTAVGNEDVIDMKQDVIGDIWHGEAITDRKSTFQAHMTRITTASQITAVLNTLQGNKKIKRATHNIYAYRIGNDEQGFNDDGESGAGIKLLSLLQTGNFTNLLVVVTRWYGGTQLGNDRFKHIQQTARDVLRQYYLKK